MLWTAPDDLIVRSAANYQYHIYPAVGMKLVTVSMNPLLVNAEPQSAFVKGQFSKEFVAGRPLARVLLAATSSRNFRKRRSICRER